MMRNRIQLLSILTWLPLTLILVYSYARIWLTEDGIWLTKPYIYRQFVPLAAGFLVWLTGMEQDRAVVWVVVLCGLGFAFAIHTLYRGFHEQ